MKKIPSSEITPQSVYLSRRSFFKRAGLLVGAAALAGCTAPAATDPAGGSPAATGQADELGDKLTDYRDVITYNNFYEFSLDKEVVSRMAQGWVTSPWSVSVGGLVNRPQVYDVDDLRRLYDEEERIYRMRCVEGWSMVIPWLGFPLSKLLKDVEPTSRARYVRFESVYDPAALPGQRDNWFNWPYVEGLRLDEAMHDLTLLSTGLYGAALLPQNGAPLRLVVPWKYGFKSIKSIVKIDLVEEMPTSLWMNAAPQEYGFYANVNPDVDHPRWSQATERRIGEISRRETLRFNGYEDAVAALYADLDLKQNY
jgi:sulfoxide reductase catalytic subunit YedY